MKGEKVALTRKTKQKAVKLTALFLTACICFPGHHTTSHADNNELTNEYIQQRENEISAIEQERNALQQGINDYQAILRNLRTQRNNMAAYIEQVDAQLMEIEANIVDMSQRIEAKEIEIQEAEAELAAAQQQAQEQYEAMKVRIRFMYEEGSSYYMEILFSSTGFADMLNKADYIEAISEYDRQKLQEYILTEQLIAVCRDELQAQQDLLQAQKEWLEEERASQEALIAQAEIDMAVMRQDISEATETLEQLNAELTAQTETIEALEAQIAAEKRRLAELNHPQITYDGGAFLWPCPSSHNITSEYGWRRHPILGVDRFHNGIDIGAKSGAAILAAYDGTVVAASYTSAMGNYLMVDHGDGLYTIYMHCSAFYVQEGQYVSRGETIAAVGSTGLSTGPHLHFTVRRNGEYVSPLDYVSP